MSDTPLAELDELKKGLESGSVHPMDAKKALGRELVARYHSAADAARAEENFISRFRDNQIPDDMPEVKICAAELGAGTALLCKVLALASLVKSNGEGRRAIQQGGVKINGERVSDESLEIACSGEYILQVGKRRFARIVFE